MALYLREPDAKPVDLGMQSFMRADDIPNGTNQIDEHLPGRAQGPSSGLMKCHMAPRMCVTLPFFLISNSSVDGGVTNASN